MVNTSPPASEQPGQNRGMSYDLAVWEGEPYGRDDRSYQTDHPWQPYR